MIGSRLKLLREECGYKQVEMAKKLGITSATYSMYEADKREPDHDKVVLMADIFNTSVDFLLGRTDNPKNPNIDHGLLLFKDGVAIHIGEEELVILEAIKKEGLTSKDVVGVIKGIGKYLKKKRK